MAIVLTACQESASLDEERSRSVGSDLAAQRSKTPFLAYEHNVSVKLEKDDLLDTFNELINRCVNDTEHQCVILSSSHNAGSYSYAGIKMRLSPVGVKQYLEFISAAGEVSSQSTTAEDLTDVISDTEKRLDMLAKYGAKLEQLEQDPNNNIDSLIKISSEMAQVQTQLEYAQGEKAKLYQRTTQDLLNINMQSNQHEAFFDPITEAFDEFGENIAHGISVFITALAYLLPWILALWLVFYTLRLIWRRTHKK
jgi:hypothetical protein